MAEAADPIGALCALANHMSEACGHTALKAKEKGGVAGSAKQPFNRGVVIADKDVVQRRLMCIVDVPPDCRGFRTVAAAALVGGDHPADDFIIPAFLPRRDPGDRPQFADISMQKIPETVSDPLFMRVPDFP